MPFLKVLRTNNLQHFIHWALLWVMAVLAWICDLHLAVTSIRSMYSLSGVLTFYLRIVWSLRFENDDCIIIHIWIDFYSKSTAVFAEPDRMISVIIKFDRREKKKTENNNMNASLCSIGNWNGTHKYIIYECIQCRPHEDNTCLL